MPNSLSAGRRHCLRMAAAWLAAGLGVAHGASPRTLPIPQSLADELADALAHRQPLLVMVSLPGCPFCKVVRENHLLPLMASGQPVVQIDMKEAQPVRDFAGRAQTQDGLVREWGVRIAPTVLFFGAGGREVAQRLTGAYLPDFYGAYLDDRLAQARRALMQADAAS